MHHGLRQVCGIPLNNGSTLSGNTFNATLEGHIAVSFLQLQTKKRRYE